MRFLGALLLALAGHGAALAEPVSAPPAAQGEVPQGKLPATVVPLAYRLDLTVDPARDRFSGTVEIDARLAVASSTIFLHGRNLAMRRTVATVNGKAIAGTWREADPTGVAALTFAAPLPAGPVTFAFAYDAPFNDGPAGMFRVKVGEEWYSWSQFQSIDARAAFPSFDEPGFRTPFAVTLRTRPGMIAVSNAPLASVTREGGHDVHRFAPTPPISTYLVAMMTGPFASVASAVPPGPHRPVPLPLRVISPQPNKDRLSFALEGSREIVLQLEDYFGEAFPFAKLDQITSPILPGAMENPGADLYNDSIIVLDAKASIVRQRRFGMVVSHELAHQWFGDLVTPAWWDDIWLNESFANWMGYHIGGKWRPALKIDGGGLGEGFAAMDTDALLAGRPIRQPIATNARIDSAFDAITYGKGGHVIAMVAGYMGEERFRDGVRRYIGAHRFANATSDDFFAALAGAAGDPQLVAAMRSFTDQQGVPLLMFTRKGSAFGVSQQRYTALGTAPGSARWTVPMCVRRGPVRHCQLLAERSAAFALPGKGPLVPNAGGLGYYRFDLPRRDWDALIVRADRLPGGEAQALADSLKASFRTGRATTRQLVAAARKLVRNPDSHASDAAGLLLDAMTSADLVGGNGLFAFRALVGRLYAPLVRKHGFDPRAGLYAGDDPDVAERRTEAVTRLANWNRDRKLRRQLANAAAAFLAGDTAALDPEWFDLAFGAHLEVGGLASAKALAAQAVASQDADFRPAVLGALASSGSTAIAAWLLSEWQDERLRVSERRQLLRGIMGMRATRETGYRWLREHLDALTSGDQGIFFAARLPQLLGGFCTAERAREFERELTPRFAGKPGELELARAIERVRNCGLLRETLAGQVSVDLAQMR